jgi:chromate transporter
LSLWFALHVLFGRITATWHGPVQIWTPELASLNVEALALASLAAVLLFGVRLGIATTLAISASGALAWFLLRNLV